MSMFLTTGPSPSPRAAFLGGLLLSLAACTPPEPPIPYSWRPGTFEVKFHWKVAKPPFDSSLFVFGRVEDWGTEEHTVLGVAGPLPYDKDPQLDFNNIRTGSQRVVVVEFREGNSGSARKRYYGISAPFELSTWKHTDVTVEMDMVPTPAGGPAAVSIAPTSLSGPERVSNPVVTVQLFTDRAESAKVSTSSLFPPDTTTPVTLDRPCPGSAPDGVHCYLLEHFNLLDGMDGGNGCGDPAGCTRSVYAIFQDHYGYESDPVSTRVTLDQVGPSLGTGAGVQPERVNGLVKLVVTVVANEPLLEEPRLEPARLAFTLVSSQGTGSGGQGAGLVYQFSATQPASLLGDDGVYSVTATLKDLAGNPSQADGGPAALTVGQVTLDQSPPGLLPDAGSVSPSHVKAGERVDVEFVVSEALEEGSLPVVSLGGQPLPDPVEARDGNRRHFRVSHVITDADAEGTLQAVVQMRDVAGNPGVSTVPGTVDVDHTPPTLAVTTNSPVGQDTVLQVTVTATEELAGPPTLHLTPEPPAGTFTQPPILEDHSYTFIQAAAALQETTYELRVEATDLAGNSRTTEASRITVDKTGPAISGTAQLCVENPGEAARCQPPLFARGGSLIRSTFATADADVQGLKLRSSTGQAMDCSGGDAGYQCQLQVQCGDGGFTGESLHDFGGTATDSRGNRGELDLGHVFVDCQAPTVDSAALQLTANTADVEDGLVALFTMDGFTSRSASVQDVRGGQELGNLGARPAAGRWGSGLATGLDGGHALGGVSGLPGGDAPRTLAAWVYLRALPADTAATILALWDAQDGGTGRGVELSVLASATTRTLAVTTDVNPLSHATTPAELPDRAWVHVAFTYDGQAGTGTRVLYLQGRPVQQDHLASPLQGGASTLALGSTAAGTHLLDGVLSDVRVYSRALSALDVAALAFHGPLGQGRRGQPRDVTVGTAVDLSLVTSEPLGAWDGGPGIQVHAGDDVNQLDFSITASQATAHHARLQLDRPVSADLPVQVDMVDRAGNRGTVVLPDVRLGVDSVPPAAPDTREEAVMFRRVPWGAQRNGAVLETSLTGSVPPVPAGHALLVLDGPNPALAAELARLDFLGGESTWTLPLRTGDRPVVWLAAVDGAGNVSPTAEARAVEWNASTGGKTTGSTVENPNVVTTVPALRPSLQQDPRKSVEASASQYALLTHPGSTSSAVYRGGTPGWTQRFLPGAPPAARMGHSVVLDTRRGRLLVLGGVGGGEPMPDTWVWEDESWVQLPAGNGPTRANGAAVYDSRRDQVVYFGGSGNSGPRNQSAELWFLNGNAWSLRTQNLYPVPEPWPSKRTRSCAAYDAARGRMVMFGGFDSYAVDSDTDTTHWGNPLGDTWEWDGQAWTQVCAPGTCNGHDVPAPRAGCAMAYDPDRRRVVMFGGHRFVAAGQDDALFQDTWEWDGRRWQQLAVTGTAPGGRAYSVMTYDTVHRAVLLSGGSTIQRGFQGHVLPGTLFGDVWTWNGTRWSLFKDLGAGSAAARMSHAGVFDPRTRKLFEFGGVTGRKNAGADPDFDNDTLEWDGVTMGRRQPSLPVTPGQLDGAAFAYDAKRARTVVFGGKSSWSQVSADTWEWDGTNWSKRNPQGISPGPRWGASMAYVNIPGQERVILFGGHDTTGMPDSFDPSGGMYDDMWSWDGQVWQRLCAHCGPPARGRATLAYDPVQGTLLLAGGAKDTSRTPQPLEADTWEWLPVMSDAGAPYAWTEPEVVSFWHERCGPTTTPCPFSARFSHAMGHDESRHYTLMYGGCTDAQSPCTRNKETWKWNGSQWEHICTDFFCTSFNQMNQGAFGAMTYDPTRKLLVLFGGMRAGNSTAFLATRFEFDGDAWSIRSLESTYPRERLSPVLTYDRLRQVLVVYGGEGAADDTWEWSAGITERPAVLFSVALGAASPGTGVYQDVNVFAEAAGDGATLAPVALTGVDLAFFDQTQARAWNVAATGPVGVGGSSSLAPVQATLRGDDAVRRVVTGTGAQQSFTVAVMPVLAPGMGSLCAVGVAALQASVHYCRGGCDDGVRASYSRPPAPWPGTADGPGEVLLTQVERVPSQTWGTGQPSAPVRAAGFRARFESAFRVRNPGDYTFALDTPSQARLWVDGLARLDTWNGIPLDKPLALEEGWHTLLLDTAQPASNPYLSLTWQGPDTEWAWEELPAGVLRAPAAACAACMGLTRVIHSGDSFAEPMVAGSRQTIGTAWATPLASAGALGVDWYSVEWAGELVVPEDGTYQFVGTTADSIRVTVDGTRVLQRWNGGSAPLTGSIPLTQGNHVFLVESMEQASAAMTGLQWSGPSFALRELTVEDLRSAGGP